MKVNPNYLGRLFTENELTEEDRRWSETSSTRKEKGKFFSVNVVIVLFYEEFAFYPSVLTIVGSAYLWSES